MDIEKVVEKIVQEVISKLEREKNIGREILFAGEKRDDLIIKYEDFIEDWKDIDFVEDGCLVNNYKVIIVPELTLNNLIDISFGRETDKISSLIVDGFLNGLSILLIEEGLKYRKYENTSNSEFYKYIKSIEERLKDFGIEFISLINLKKKLKSYKNIEASALNVGKKLITNEDVDKILNLGENKIRVSKNSIITALAKDSIEANEIKIQIID